MGVELGKFSIGDVLSNTFRTYGHTVFTLTIFFAGSMFVPVILGVVALTPIIIWISTQGTIGSTFIMGIAAIALVLFVIAMVMVGILGVINGAVLSMDGQRPTIRSCLSAGLKSTIRGMLAYLVAVIAMILGLVPIFAAASGGAGGFTLILLLAFYVGLGIALCVYYPIGAVIAMESRGVFRSFSRAAALTRGNRWRIFGMILAWFAISFAASLLLMLFLYLLGVGPEEMASYQFEFDGIPAVLAFVLYVLFMISIYVLAFINVGVLYARLRDIVDGPSADAAARVFD